LCFRVDDGDLESPGVSGAGKLGFRRPSLSESIILGGYDIDLFLSLNFGDVAILFRGFSGIGVIAALRVSTAGRGAGLRSIGCGLIVIMIGSLLALVIGALEPRICGGCGDLSIDLGGNVEYWSGELIIAGDCPIKAALVCAAGFGLIILLA
jgi:hypothetical protein